MEQFLTKKYNSLEILNWQISLKQFASTVTSFATATLRTQAKGLGQNRALVKIGGIHNAWYFIAWASHTAYVSSSGVWKIKLLLLTLIMPLTQSTNLESYHFYLLFH